MNSKLIKVKISPYLSVFKIIDVIFKNTKVGTAQNIIKNYNEDSGNNNGGSGNRMYHCLGIPVFHIECPPTFRKIH
jgi:hypothetical protein